MDNPKVSVASKIKTAQTPAEKLRLILTQLEGYIGQMGMGNQEQAVTSLFLLDQADALIEDLERQGADLGPERLRFQSLTRQLNRKAESFLKELGGAEALSQIRDREQPPADHTWWYSDRQLRERRATERRQILIKAGVIVLVISVLSTFYMLFLAPDEATRLHYRHEQNAQQALSQGDFHEALIQAETSLSYAPGDGDLLTLQGVAHELLGSGAAAQRAFAEARTAYGDSETFYLSRAQIYMTADHADLAIADVDRVIESHPDSALAYFQRGNANAELGNLSDAIADLEKASELAEASGQPELQGMARVQLGNLMMLMSAPQSETPTSGP